MQSRTWWPGRLALLVVLCAGVRAAHAEEPAENLGLNLDLGVSSAYNWRGLNAFGADQHDPNAYVAPGVTWTVTPGFTLGYWGAYQVLGDNASAKVDTGVGAEQDLILGYGMPVAEGTTVSLGFVAYLYPLADARSAGVTNPTYLEPSAAIAWAGPVDVGLKASYYAGVQRQLDAYRYVYVNPTVGKTVALSSRVGLGLSLGLGYKALAGDYAAVSNGNRLDVAASVAAPIAVGDRFYVKPAVNAAWTDLDRAPSGDAAKFGDQAFVFGSLNVGANL